MKTLLRFPAVSTAKFFVVKTTVRLGREIFSRWVYWSRGRYPHPFGWVYSKSLDPSSQDEFRYEEVFPDKEDFQTPLFHSGDAKLTQALWGTATAILLEHGLWSERERVRILLVKKSAQDNGQTAVASFRLYRLAEPSTPSRR